MPKARSAEVDLPRLCDAVRSSRKVLERFRSERREAVRKYAGDHWSTETSQVPRPVNFLSLFLTVVSRNLISHDPRVNLTTSEKKYRPTVTAMQGWANDEIVRMELGETLARVVMDGLFSVGITKVALASPAESEVSGWNLKAGQPYACPVDLDDFAYDTHARDFREAGWMGHRSRVLVESIRDSKLYEAAKRKQVTANPDKQFNESGDERISMLGRQYVSGDTCEPWEYVDLWEIYLPRQRMILTLLSEDGGTPSPSQFKGENAPFAQRDWVGPYCGPYHFLKYMVVPGNAMPKGPVQDIIDMDEALNGLTQKLINQAGRQKEIVIASGNADGDVFKLTQASDGEAIRVDNPDKVKPTRWGGVDPGNLQFSMDLWAMLNKLGGNVELMGGLGAQSKTATQDKMLNANSSKSVVDMQQVTVKHAADVIKSLCWFWHHHPEKTMTSYHDVTGLDTPIRRDVTPEARRQVPFEALKIQVDPYSFQYQTPAERLGFVNNVVTQIITPMLPLLQQQGIFFDLNAYLELVARYGNSPDLTDIVRIGAAPEGDAQGDGRNDVRMPTSTSREYTRHNTSEKTDDGQNQQRRQALVAQAGRNGTYQGAGR